MIRPINFKDIDQVNILLSKFNYKLSEETLNSDFLSAIVYEDNGIKGVLVYDLIYDRIEINYIIVDIEYRRLGIATELLNYLENNNKYIYNITLEVNVNNKSAIEFYKKNGFNSVALRKKYYGEDDGILMMKKRTDCCE